VLGYYQKSLRDFEHSFLYQIAVEKEISTACLSRAGLKLRQNSPVTAGGTDLHDLASSLFIAT
jgi:hypothetical protein